MFVSSPAPSVGEPPINVTIISPTEGEVFTQENNSLTYSINYTGTETITYYIYNNGTFNQTVLGNTSINFSNGDYAINVSAYNTTDWSVNATVTFTIAVSTTTCTYSGSGTWNIDCNDECSIDSQVNLKGNSLFLSGIGSVNVNANILNMGKSQSIFNVPSGCYVNFKKGTTVTIVN